MRIDEVRLNLGRVVYKDYSQGGDRPKVNVYDIGIKDKVYKNIKSAQQFAALVMVEALGSTAIQGAKIYGAATLLGVGFLPAGVAGALVGQDSGVQEFVRSAESAYRAALKAVREMGELKSENRDAGVIKAKVDGADVAVRVEAVGGSKSKLTVSARKFLLPKPEIANGVLYQIEQELK